MCITIKDLFDLNETIAAKLFDGVTYPWEVLPKIHDFIIENINTELSLPISDTDFRPSPSTPVTR